MVLLPKPNCRTSTPQLQLQVHENNNQLLVTTLEQPSYNVVTTTSTLIGFARKELVTKRRFFGRGSAAAIMRCVCLLGSWTKLAWSSATWTLLMCLLFASGRKGHEDDYSSSGCGGSADHHRVLSSLQLDGTLTFSNTSSAAADFGLIHFAMPSAVVYPRSVRDVQVTVRAVLSAASSGLTVAAKGRGHSVHGQAQVLYTRSSSLTLIDNYLRISLNYECTSHFPKSSMKILIYIASFRFRWLK